VNGLLIRISPSNSPAARPRLLAYQNQDYGLSGTAQTNVRRVDWQWCVGGARRETEPLGRKTEHLYHVQDLLVRTGKPLAMRASLEILRQYSMA